MSQTKLHKITVRPRAGHQGKISVGTNTEVLLDGEPLRGCSFLKLEFKAKKVTKVALEIYAEVEVEEVTTTLEATPPKSTGLKDIKGKLLGLFTLSNYGPQKIYEKESANERKNSDDTRKS